MSVCFSVCWVFFSSYWWTSSAFIVHSYSGAYQVLDSEDITHLAASSPHFSHHLHHQCKQCKRINANIQYNLCFLLHQRKHIVQTVQTYIVNSVCYVCKPYNAIPVYFSSSANSANSLCYCTLVKIIWCKKFCNCVFCNKCVKTSKWKLGDWWVQCHIWIASILQK